MAASFQHQGVVVSTFPSVAAPANNINATQMELSSFQAQERSGHKQKLLKGEHKALGVVQIMLGIIQMTFGFAHYNSDPCVGSLATPWWTGVWYIISGSLAVSVEKIPKKSLIVGNLVMSILSSIAAGLGTVIYTLLLFSGPQCIRYDSASPHPVTFRILVGCLLGFTGLEFVISIVASGFSCHGLGCGEQDYKLNTIVIQSPGTQNSPAQAPEDANYETIFADHSSYETLKYN